MISRKVRNVMTREVMTVTEQTPFTEMVRLMAVHKISALPVLDDDGHVVGIVSEADLLRKEEYQDEQDEPGWLKRHHQRVARGKAAARTAAGVMSAPVITVNPEATVPMAARLLRGTGSSACRSSTARAGWLGSSAGRTCCGCSFATTRRSTVRSSMTCCCGPCGSIPPRSW
jgi:CBS-domain-containing membrane protein